MTPNEPLSPEERDLAERLQRLGGPREPAPALDARILAAARAAVSDTAPAHASDPADAGVVPGAAPNVVPLRPRAKAPRWPLGFGLAASLVLAAGIGWRLHGDGDGSLKATEDAAPAAAFESDEHVTEAVILPPELQREPPPPPPQETEAQMPRMRAPASPAQLPGTPPPEFVADTPARTAEPVVAADAAVAEGYMDVRSAAANEADTGGDAAAHKDKALDSVIVTGSRSSAERNVGAAEYTRTPLNERREQTASKPSASTASDRAAAKTAVAKPVAPPPAAAPPAPPPPSVMRQNSVARDEEVKRRADLTGGALEQRKSEGSKEDSASADAFGTYGFDDQPPASADSPQVRQAWLQRIRDLLARGETVAAAKSLQEFRRRYPQAELPEDLRKLAATLPPASP